MRNWRLIAFEPTVRIRSLLAFFTLHAIPQTEGFGGFGVNTIRDRTPSAGLKTGKVPVNSSKKIVFFVASFSSSEATAPLGILAISTPLLEAGYEIRIIDASITPDYKKRIMEEVQDALCLGVSLVTGLMIRETVEVAKAIKARGH